MSGSELTRKLSLDILHFSKIIHPNNSRKRGERRGNAHGGHGGF